MSKINYNLSLIRAFVFDVDGVLSPVVVPMLEDGRPARMANVRDGFAMKEAVRRGYMIAVITGADTESVRRRMSLIGVTDVFLGAGDKLEILKRWMAEKGLRREEVAFAGDDVPDGACMRHVGLSVAPRDADNAIRNEAVFVSSCRGGYGVARELIQETMLAQGTWPTSAKAFG
ncbi:MAG: 3-deoxy-D-manno-octulosonate 8-phosphate phosphatase [Muribaculaceae bacterium]|nr:3-deoxy-D-manno-octulosonate 8-phosphate phosphatase [Muribaculaceae bacterium]